MPKLCPSFPFSASPESKHRCPSDYYSTVHWLQPDMSAARSLVSKWSLSARDIGTTLQMIVMNFALINIGRIADIRSDRSARPTTKSPKVIRKSHLTIPTWPERCPDCRGRAFNRSEAVSRSGACQLDPNGTDPPPAACLNAPPQLVKTKCLPPASQFPRLCPQVHLSSRRRHFLCWNRLLR